MLHVLNMPKVKGGKKSVLGAESYGISGMIVQLIKCLEQKGFLWDKSDGITGSLLIVTVCYYTEILVVLSQKIKQKEFLIQ